MSTVEEKRESLNKYIKNIFIYYYMVKIAFWDNGLGERGTSVALYDYAHYNEVLLGNESIILYNNTHYSNKADAIKKFTDRFNVISVNNWSKVDTILSQEKCDIIYIIKAGDYDGQLSKVCKNVVHCVFNCNSPHGQVYASIAPWVNNNNGKYPYVPHIINLPNHTENFRKELNIPDNSCVFGRYGGYKQFDIPFVQKTVYAIAKANPHIYFLFMNTELFCNSLPNIIHLPMIIDLNIKTKFINTCDAMIWGRSDGEVYSLSQGEFSSKNKPILCTNIGYKGHVYKLGDKAIWYTNETDLSHIILSFDKDKMCKKDWNAYTDSTPEKVMKIFNDVFIQPCLTL
uniref:Glycosyltransferase n=1 Tax=viral metagenome TaxID=1070528 RepID=A0A6C0EUV8_9ZZZZ